MRTGLMYHSTGLPVIEQHYYAPGQFVFREATVRISRTVVEGEVISVHERFGIVDEYEVIAFDSEEVLLQRFYKEQ